jgi:hypothetical protein
MTTVKTPKNNYSTDSQDVDIETSQDNDDTTTDDTDNPEEIETRFDCLIAQSQSLASQGQRALAYRFDRDSIHISFAVWDEVNRREIKLHSRVLGLDHCSRVARNGLNEAGDQLKALLEEDDGVSSAEESEVLELGMGMLPRLLLRLTSGLPREQNQSPNLPI